MTTVSGENNIALKSTQSVPLVSIITSNFNGEKFLTPTINSVLNQSLQAWEWIFVDDCSTDNSVAILNSVGDPRIKIIRLKENHGPAFGRTKAMEAAIGTYLAFLDSDDLWAPEKLERQLHFMQENKSLFSCHAYQRMSESEGNVGPILVPPRRISYIDLLKRHSIGTLTVILHSSLRPLKMDAGLVEDLGFWLKILGEKKVDSDGNALVADGMPDNLARYRVVENSRSANKFWVAQSVLKTYLQRPDLNLFSAFYYFLHYAVSSLLKYRQFR